MGRYLRYIDVDDASTFDWKDDFDGLVSRSNKQLTKQFHCNWGDNKDRVRIVNASILVDLLVMWSSRMRAKVDQNFDVTEYLEAIKIVSMLLTEIDLNKLYFVKYN